MRHLVHLLALAVMAGIFASSVARAQCTEDARRVTLDKDNVVRLKSYACQAGERADAPKIKVELHRFSERAASLIVAKRSSTLLAKTIGTPRVTENDVFKAYAELVQKFGITEDVQMLGETSMAIQSPSGDVGDVLVTDKISGSKVRTLPPSLETGGEYPAADEIAALRKKSIPAGLKFFYGVTCQDEDADKLPPKTTCKTYDKSDVTMIFWRPMRTEDVANFGQSIKAYNLLLTKYKAELRASGKQSALVDDPMSDRIPMALRLFQFVAGNVWPEDFIYVSGSFDEREDPCSGSGVGRWHFYYSGRDIFLDAFLIENASKQPVSIGGLFGHRLSEPRLRTASAPLSSGSGTGQLGDMSETLGPGQRLLVPIKILLAPNPLDKQVFRYTQTSREILDRLGTNKFSGNAAAHEAPRFRDYIYGPELTVSGFLLNGSQVDLVQPAANFTVLAQSGQVGSCPYLLSWDAQDREWIEHGKVLHRAQGQQQEYTETIVLPGFRPQFRLEEREAEVAFIDQAELTVVLVGGETLTLKPQNAELAARDVNYLQLLWGDAVELAFELPHDVVAAAIAESRLVLTGFYERYSNLLASSSDKPTSLTAAQPGRLLGGSPSMSRGDMCPAPDLASASTDSDL